MCGVDSDGDSLHFNDDEEEEDVGAIKWIPPKFNRFGTTVSLLLMGRNEN